MNSQPARPSCGCSCGARACTLSRRDFIQHTALLAGGGLALASEAAETAPAAAPAQTGRPLRVQPVLVYSTPKRKEATSWRNWGGIQTEAQAEAERRRIGEELAGLAKQASFPLDVRPVAMVRNKAEATPVAGGDYDVMLMYAAGGWLDALEPLTREDRYNLMFLRHESGPVYLWYEVVSPRFLRKMADDYGQKGIDVHDVVVDRPEELLWRLRALSGLKRSIGQRVVAIGGAGGWGDGGRDAPKKAREIWKMDLVEYSHDRLSARLKEAMGDAAGLQRADDAATRYLRSWHVSLRTSRNFVRNAFVLADVFREILREADTDAITVHHCMGPIMGIAQTTACLTLSLLNDEGKLAFCESDFVVIPSGVLLHRIAGTPVFLNDPTFPHDGVITLAHCTAPRRMDGRRLEPVLILTHFESDYGAAPKVEMRKGQVCTNLVPDFSGRRWIGLEGTIIANPFHDICRSQIDMRINGDADALMEQMKGFHWMTSYGNYLRECRYAVRKLGIEFTDLSSKSTA